MKKTISLIVLNFDGVKLLKEYFDSVFAQSLIPEQIIMLDNASTDASVSFVKKNYPQVQIVVNTKNDGTAGGSNVGARHATGDYIIFQSNDLRLDRNCIRGLIATIQSDRSIGIVTSVLVKERKSTQRMVDNAGGVVDKYGFGMQNYPNVPFETIPEIGSVFFSYGGSFIIRKADFQKLHGYDERYFTLNDDIDLSWRIRLLGKNIVYTKQSFVYHKVSATLGPLFDQPSKRYWSERNSMATLIKNYSGALLPLRLVQYVLLLTAEIGYFAVRGRFDLAFADLKAIFWNIKQIFGTLSRRRYIQKIRTVSDSTLPFVQKSIKLSLFTSFNNAL